MTAPFEQTNTHTLTQSNKRPYDEIIAVLEEDFGEGALATYFATFERVPIASASLAQVHRATLKTGEQVAVKIQHPSLRESSTVDVRVVDSLVRLVKWVYPHVDYRWITEEMVRNLPLELNFVHEAANCEMAAANFADRRDVVVPTVYRATPRVRQTSTSGVQPSIKRLPRRPCE
jgi:aarF domain-containing kinase